MSLPWTIPGQVTSVDIEGSAEFKGELVTGRALFVKSSWALGLKEDFELFRTEFVIEWVGFFSWAKNKQNYSSVSTYASEIKQDVIHL